MKIFRSIAKTVIFIGSITGVILLSHNSLKKEKKLQRRYRAYYEITNQWLQNKMQNKSSELFFKEKNINNLAIYGMGTLGEVLYQDLKLLDIKVEYFIDKNFDSLYSSPDNIPVCSPREISSQSHVDALIITPFFDFQAIKSEFEELNSSFEIISLEDIILAMK